METICKTCRHYQEIPDQERSGICFIQLPVWMAYFNKQNGKAARVVDDVDTCDLWNIDKADRPNAVEFSRATLTQHKTDGA